MRLAMFGSDQEVSKQARPANVSYNNLTNEYRAVSRSRGLNGRLVDDEWRRPRLLFGVSLADNEHTS